MDYKVIEIHSDNIASAILEKVMTFCRLAVDENKHEARSNMQVEGWELNPSSLLYLLLIEKRFSESRGGLQLLMHNDEIVAVSGYYRADFNEGVYLMGVRSWVLKTHRFNLLVAEYLLPYQLAEIQRRGGHTAAISFNDSTKAFAKLIERSNKSADAKLKFFFGENYPDIYKDMILWEKPVKIKEVKQWVLIKKLLPGDFDWNTINWV
jgi:hypothetical protein